MPARIVALFSGGLTGFIAEHDMSDRIGADRNATSNLPGPIWKRRVALHLALFPARSLDVQLTSDRIRIDARLLDRNLDDKV